MKKKRKKRLLFVISHKGKNSGTEKGMRIFFRSPFVFGEEREFRFGKDRRYYIDTLFFPGTRAEWETQIKPNDWRNKKCRRIVCADEMKKD
jgi:hypothetical protein